MKDTDAVNSMGPDDIACQYDQALARGLRFSGENRAYFAAGRLKWLAVRLRQFGFTPETVMDFGCGAGATVPVILQELGAKKVIGIDNSAALLEKGARHYGNERVEFELCQNYAPSGNVDLVYCNGVFHHIAEPERPSAVSYVCDALRVGGYFALWENNPWNPGTRFVMSRIAFDRDAVPLASSGARAMLQKAGFKVLRTDFLFVFPRVLALFRWLEPHIAALPLGAQYQVLCQKR